mmetsp:Transcript_1119/g.2202  ORF Transcript_1119/g.2202 Transcript_1119/m.2202 type:complete len:104 (+) Transcript_1119:931-1242(+)
MQYNPQPDKIIHLNIYTYFSSSTCKKWDWRLKERRKNVWHKTIYDGSTKYLHRQNVINTAVMWGTLHSLIRIVGKVSETVMKMMVGCICESTSYAVIVTLSLH